MSSPKNLTVVLHYLVALENIKTSYENKITAQASYTTVLSVVLELFTLDFMIASTRRFWSYLKHIERSERELAQNVLTQLLEVDTQGSIHELVQSMQKNIAAVAAQAVAPLIKGYEKKQNEAGITMLLLLSGVILALSTLSFGAALGIVIALTCLLIPCPYILGFNAARIDLLEAVPAFDSTYSNEPDEHTEYERDYLFSQRNDKRLHLKSSKAELRFRFFEGTEALSHQVENEYEHLARLEQGRQSQVPSL